MESNTLILMGAAGCRTARVGPDDASPRSSSSSDEGSSEEPAGGNEGGHAPKRKRLVVHHDAQICKFCPVLINQFNRMEGGVCAACARVVFHQYQDRRMHSRMAIMENAGHVFRALDQAYRVKKFVSGVDELRDKYFERKVVAPWIKEEQHQLRNEALVGGNSSRDE